MKHTFMQKYFLILVSILFLLSCKKGELLDNQAPETKLFLDAINLTGTDRLNSVVTMHWTGEDVDGYVQGYEFSFDGTNWIKTTVQDSTFRFSISGGSDTTNIEFYVRAIDNKEKADLSPAHLTIPIKNTAPSVNLDNIKLIPDTVFSVFSVLWEAKDLDGFDNLDSVFVKMNNGNWVALSKNVNFITVVPQNAKNAGIQSGNILKNLSADSHNIPLNDVKVDDWNHFYIKVKDIAGSYSQVDTSNLFYIRRQSSDFLVIDDHAGTTSPTPEECYLPIFQNLGLSYDKFTLAGINAHVPPFWEPTFRLFLAQYDRVFWYSDGAENSSFGTQMYLEVAASPLQQYLNSGGKLFITTKFPSRFNAKATALDSPIFGFSPIDSFSTSVGQARIATDSSVYAVNSFSATLPILKPSAFISGVDPFYAKDPNQVMYAAQLQLTGGWVGTNNIAGRSVFSNNKTNQVFFILELNKLNGNPTALQTMFDKILNEEFNW